MSQNAVKIDFDHSDCGLPRFFVRPAAFYFTRPTIRLEMASPPSVWARARRSAPETTSCSPPRSVTVWRRRWHVFKSHATTGTSNNRATSAKLQRPPPDQSSLSIAATDSTDSGFR